MVEPSVEIVASEPLNSTARREIDQRIQEQPLKPEFVTESAPKKEKEERSKRWDPTKKYQPFYPSQPQPQVRSQSQAVENKDLEEFIHDNDYGYASGFQKISDAESFDPVSSHAKRIIQQRN